MEEDVSAIEEVGTVTLSSLERSPLLRSLCGRRSFAELEVSNFHVASTRFWEAVLLPCAVVVVVAFSSCLELWIGQCVSLACWYAVNYYAMGYTVQVLHPQNHSECGRLWLSPFGGGVQLALWSVGSAVLEVFLLHSLPSPSVAHMVGTVLYATCGCLWLHLWIAPWRCVPEGWRQMLRRWEDRRKEKRSQAEEPVHESPRRRDAALAAGWRRSTEEGSLAGHAAFAIAGYALLVTFQDVAELRGPWRPNAPSIPAMPMPTMPMASKARRWTAGAAVETAVSAPQRSRPSRVDARPRMARSRMPHDFSRPPARVRVTLLAPSFGILIQGCYHVMDLTPPISVGSMLDDKLSELSDRLKRCESQLRRSETAAEAKAEEIKMMKDTLAGKADAEEIIARVDDLAQALQRKADSADVATKLQLEAVKMILELKADGKDVASKEQVILLQQQLGSFEAKSSSLATQLQELQQSLATKADRSLVPSLEVFDAKMQEKADASSVPTNGHLKAVMKILELKADSEKVVKITDFQALQQTLQDCVAAKSQLHALNALVLTKEAELQSLQAELQRKANAAEVATALDLRSLEQKLQDVVTTHQHQALTKTLENKADSWDVVSLRKLLETKAASEEVPKIQDFQRLVHEVSEKADSKDVPSMEEFDTLREALDEKANRCETATKQSLESLQQDVPSRAAIIVLNRALQTKANQEEVATKEELQALVSSLKGKADVTSVPNWKDFHHLRDRVQRKADRDGVPSLAQFQSMNSTLAKLVEGDSTPGTLKRRRSPDPHVASPVRAPSTPARAATTPAQTPAPQTPRPCPGTPRPLTAPAQPTSPVVPAPGTPKPQSLTPFAPRKAAKKSDTPTVEVQQVATPARAASVEEKVTKEATTPARPRGRPRKDRGEEATTPARKAQVGYPKPHSRVPKVKSGAKKGESMVWSTSLGNWVEP